MAEWEDEILKPHKKQFESQHLIPHVEHHLTMLTWSRTLKAKPKKLQKIPTGSEGGAEP